MPAMVVCMLGLILICKVQPWSEIEPEMFSGVEKVSLLKSNCSAKTQMPNRGRFCDGDVSVGIFSVHGLCQLTRRSVCTKKP
jgi:hypothetical protein